MDSSGPSPGRRRVVRPSREALRGSIPRVRIGRETSQGEVDEMTEGDWLRTINRDSHTLGGVVHLGSEVPVPLHGSLDFVLHKDSAVLAKFVVVKHSAEAQAVAQILTKAWALSTPSVILSITGGALQLSITKQLESEFVDGLNRAARSANAWIFTGGTESGVMELTGKAVANVGSNEKRTPCIGLTSWRKVMHKDLILEKLASLRTTEGTMPLQQRRQQSARDRSIRYWRHEQNSSKSASLDPHHTHFILVNDETDKMSDADHPFGDEIDMRGRLEDTIRGSVSSHQARSPGHPARAHAHSHESLAHLAGARADDLPRRRRLLLQNAHGDAETA